MRVVWKHGDFLGNNGCPRFVSFCMDTILGVGIMKISTAIFISNFKTLQNKIYFKKVEILYPHSRESQ